jgi:uncharacterized membrane protein YkvA (DUF1232 family)
VSSALLWALAATLVAYGLMLAGLVLAGRRVEAAALARLVPDLARLFGGLLRDPRVPAARKLVLAPALLYLLSPIDLVPDFLPLIGALDDAIVVAFVLRFMLRGASAGVVAEHWPGPERSLRTVLRFAGA